MAPRAHRQENKPPIKRIKQANLAVPASGGEELPVRAVGANDLRSDVVCGRLLTSHRETGATTGR